MQHQENQEYTFIREQIRKKPFYRQKWFIKTVSIVGCAVVFGGAAGAAFAIVSPWAKRLLACLEEPANIVVARESENEGGTAPLAGKSAGEKALAKVPDSDGYIGISGYRELYAEMAEVAMEAEKSMVTVTGITSDLDVFQEADERSIQSAGLIVAKNNTNLYISTEWAAIDEAEKITVEFPDGTSAGARLQKKDSILGTAVVKVSLEDVPEETAENLKVAVLGNSGSMEVGMPVIAAGSPLGYSDSLAFGMVTSVVKLSVIDGQYGFLTTDMVGSEQGSGILLNLDGEIVGVIAQRFSSGDDASMLCGLDISDLRESISDLSNDTSIAYLGLRGRDISETLSEELNMPAGMFVREVMSGSPAMRAGIQKADILTALNGKKIEDVESYVKALGSCSPGEAIKLTLRRKSVDQYVTLEQEIVLGSR